MKLKGASGISRDKMNPIIQKVRRQLKRDIDPHTKTSGQKFFKETIRLYGVKTAAVGRIAEECFQDIKDSDKAGILKLCEELWRSGYLEESFIACDWSYRIRESYKAEDFKVLEKWAHRYVANWASCDTLCNHTIGAFVEKFPQALADLKRWARSKNRWVRRASAVTLIIPARKGEFLSDIFEIADILLLDDDDLVQKGYGWMLKAASEAHQRDVFEYVMKNKARMPRTALRYAIEKMPPGMKRRAMAAS